ncbi:MAG: hypothetical protein HOP01_04840 [Gallionella sp.]|nr:hypothetical protein [Gallionella sp.]
MHITRLKAASIHLVISLSIAAAVSALMLFLWYMPPLFSALGGQQVLLILLGVDVTLGPLITLLIYNPKKSRKALTFDLSLIALIQVSALVYGMTVVFHARPVFAVFSANSFDLVTANTIRKEDLVKVQHPDFKSLPFSGLVYAYTEMPKNKKERAEIVLSIFNNGKDLPSYPQYYSPYSEHQISVGSAAKSIAELRKLNPNDMGKIDQAIKASGQSEKDLGYVPMRTKIQDLVVLVGKRNGEVIQLLLLKPW